MLEREVISPERQEIERRAEYFEIYLKRRERIAVAAGWTVVTVVLALLSLLLSGCAS